MDISLALILDELGLEAASHIDGGANPKFKSVELYVIGGTKFSPENLLICPLSEAIAATKREGEYFLCIRDRMQDEHENEQTMAGITVVRSNIGLRELYNRVHRIFVKVAEWVMSMERSVAKRRGLQELLDISERIFGNFITVQDSTFKLVAYTKNIEPAGNVMGRLVEYGYHPPETMELFRRHRRVEEFKRAKGVIVSRDKVTSEFDVVKKTFHLGGSIFIIVVMECCAKPADNATVELFGIFIEYVRAYADIDIAQTGGVGGAKALAVDILSKTAGSKDEARIRSEYCGYPFEAPFRLYMFSFEDEDNVPIAHLIKHLTDSFRDAMVFSYDLNILMIESEKADIVKTCSIAHKALDTSAFICGISNIFQSLWDLPIAFEQAVISSKVASKLKLSSGNGKRFHLYSDIFLYHIVLSGFQSSPDAWENSFIARSLAILRDYDEQHRTETSKILRLFLENERSATTVAAIMHMHRNTVLYHMEKVSDLLGVTLEDPDVRLQLLLAFKADDFRNLKP